MHIAIVSSCLVWPPSAFLAAAVVLGAACATHPKVGTASEPVEAGPVEPQTAMPADPEPPPEPSASILVLHDSTGPFAWLGELQAVAVSALLGHFGASTIRPVAGYQAGDSAEYSAVVYVGSTYDEPLPPAFLADVMAGKKPVLWTGDNIWQLARQPGFRDHYGFEPSSYRRDAVTQVRYKDVTLKRYADNPAGLMDYGFLDAKKVTALADAVGSDGKTTPWAVRSRNLTYVGETPVAYVDHDDRYLAFCDLLFDLLAPDTPERHRALVRIEDVHALTPPASLRRIADYLSAEGVPFSVAVIPDYRDPRGALNGGVPTERSLAQAPEVAAALRYMVGKGGTLIMHGYTHQIENRNNPYNGASAADFEFFQTHVDPGGAVVMDGPLPNDSVSWARQRIEAGLAIFGAAGLPVPSVFEYPHYVGSVAASRAVAERFKTVYQRETYWAGIWANHAPNYARSINLFFPYPVKDVYGWRVLPENLGNYIPVGYNGNASRSASAIVESARLNRVVRDGFASFFFHPIYDVAILGEIVEGIKAQGYTFVSAARL
jgi:uncharacterized protein YdaL